MRGSVEEGLINEHLETVRTESLTDPLTSLANRKLFDQALDQAMAVAGAKGEPLSLLMTDIDHFKNFNDTYGHQTGDQVLRLVALSLTALMCLVLFFCPQPLHDLASAVLN